jgi:hypothetical protein
MRGTAEGECSRRDERKITDDHEILPKLEGRYRS